MNAFKIKFGDENLRTWKKQIRKSHVFFVLLSPAYLRSERLKQHVEYARSLGKPFRVALIEGAVIPAELFEGVTDLDIRFCGTAEDVHEYVMEVLQERGESV